MDSRWEDGSWSRKAGGLAGMGRALDAESLHLSPDMKRRPTEEVETGRMGLWLPRTWRGVDADGYTKGDAGGRVRGSEE